MPGGKGNINGNDGVRFSKDNPPKNPGRKPTKLLAALLEKHLNKKKDITITGIDPVTGQKATIRVPMPTREVIVQALLREGAKGNINAIREIFDRTDGKTTQPLELNEGVKIHVTRS